eukprot:6049178-Pleurochrysis_carterae.AAC.1
MTHTSRDHDADEAERAVEMQDSMSLVVQLDDRIRHAHIQHKFRGREAPACPPVLGRKRAAC